MNTAHIELQVKGMTCTNCALSVEKYLEKEGIMGARVDFANDEVAFDLPEGKKLPQILKGINKLGYEATMEAGAEAGKKGWALIEKRFALAALFTFPLLLHMFISWHVLHNPWVQLALALPVYLIGFWHFGRSAWASLKGGIPNMDVLIFMGATAAFGYSLYGTLLNLGPNYLFYETAASIITLVLLGNMIEHRAVQRTTSSIRMLTQLQPQVAKRLLPNGASQAWEEVPIDQVREGDLLQLNTGDRVPVDAVVREGFAELDESVVTGESMPLQKTVLDSLLSGTMVLAGNLKVEATRIGKESTLAQIIALVKNAQADKPQIQNLADKISAIFVPAVLGIATLTFLLSHFVFGLTLQASIIHSVAVLVISCPCAMGLATPTAVVVGIGKASEKGILIKGGRTLEKFSQIKRVVFDKTGTLTTGAFEVEAFEVLSGDREQVEGIVKTLSAYSNHPLSQSLARFLESVPLLSLEAIEEIKGSGIKGQDAAGNEFRLGSYRWVGAGELHSDFGVFLSKNGEIQARVRMEDVVKSDAAPMISFLKERGIEPILLSGDRKSTCLKVAQALGISEVYAEQTPEQKLQKIEAFSQDLPTAMVGDGINDAPALTQADIGISLSGATDVAIQSADVVLMHGKLSAIPDLFQVSEKTLSTIRQNLFWAFFYNVIAIPVAAVGLLSPIIGTMTMALSDVIVVGNSLRLKYR